MKGWLKRFALSLFSDGQAMESARFGLGNILLTGFLAIVFLFFGIFAGEVIPFSSRYDGADGFKEFLYRAFIPDGGAGICVTAADGKAEISANGSPVLINTLENQADAATYSVNGYQLFADSRSVSQTYDDFEAVCISRGDGAEIAYEAYLDLPQEERGSYYFSVRYTGREKIVGAAEAEEYAAYLGALEDNKIKTEFAELNEKKDTLGEDEYGNSLYTLYVKAYYPDIYSATGESVPTLLGHYYRLVEKTDGKYLCLFGDTSVFSFGTSDGNKAIYGGVYKSGNGINTYGLPRGQAEASVDDFIKGLYRDSLSMLLIFELTDSVMLIVIVEFIIVGVMLLFYAVCRLKKIRTCVPFAKSAKIVASYTHTAALIAAVAAMCLGFALTDGVSVAAYAVFAAILVVRSAVLLVRESIKCAKTEDMSGAIRE